jgi:hypothetical protein
LPWQKLSVSVGAPRGPRLSRALAAKEKITVKLYLTFLWRSRTKREGMGQPWKRLVCPWSVMLDDACPP